MSKGATRNGYIDIIKFIFALVITDFHLNTGVFPGGRTVVEGFFMISGYLMMNNIYKNKNPNDNLGVSTIRFIISKYRGLFPYLFTAIAFSFAFDCIRLERTLGTAISKIPLLIFDLIPLREAGFNGDYVIGISWYISAMFLGLAVLYPFCKKFKSNFVLTVCPFACLIIYGYFSYYYGNMAIASTYLPFSIINSGLLRGFAGCAAGCIIFEISMRFNNKNITKFGKSLFTAIEVLGFIYLFITMHNHPLSRYDFILIFVLFALLFIGINGYSYTSKLFNFRCAKYFGTASMIIVLVHSRLNTLLMHFYGNGYIHGKAAIYAVCLLVLVCIVWIVSECIDRLLIKLSKIKLFK